MIFVPRRWLRPRPIATAPPDRDTLAMAVLVQLLAHTQKRLPDYDRALAEWKSLIHSSATGAPATRVSTAELARTVGEALLQRLTHEGHDDIARKLCELACAANAPALLREHFDDRLAHLELLGKPAPVAAGKDIDCQPVSLADLKGKVVLVDFWATWCPPASPRFPRSTH